MEKYIKKYSSHIFIGTIFLMTFITIVFSIIAVKNNQSLVPQPQGLQPFIGDVDNLGAVDKFVPVKLEGWGNGWMTSPEYDGIDMPDNALVEANNIDFGVKNSIAPRRGILTLGTESSNLNPVRSLFTAHTEDGREVLIRTSTTTIEWWNAVDEAWDQLDDGYVADRIFTFTEGSAGADDWNYLYFSNGSDSLRRVRVAFGTVSANTATTITLNAVSSYDSVDDIGFPTSGTITVAGVDYSYSGISGWQLTGLSGVPALDADDGVFATVETTGFTSPPSTASTLVIKDQRLYAAATSTVFASHIGDLRNFSYSAPRVASEGEIIYFPEGGERITALAVQPSYVAVFKNNYIGRLEFKDFSDGLSDIPVVSTISQKANIGATNNNAVAYNDLSAIFVNSDIGLTEFSRVANYDYDVVKSLSERLRLTFEDYDFDSSAIAVYDNKILISAKTSSDVSFNNTIIIYDYQKNRFTYITAMNANAFAVYDNKLYFGDSLTQNVRQAFYNSYDDDGSAITSSAKTKWYNFGEPSRWKEIGWVYVEGWITQNTSLTFKINFDEGGALASKEVTISGDGDYVADEPGAGFGINPFGLSDFGTTETTGDSLRHFAGYINMQAEYGKKWRNVQFEIESSGVGYNYRITRLIPFVYVLDEQYGRSSSNLIIND